ncbi:MAG: hypothetical protein JNL38_00465 [Myxococcales bacterium]|jgi:hypothetical protein|nr:hypothetical protein [Myxococcales bacterium]
MAAREEGSGLAGARVLDGDEVEGVLSGSFYTPASSPRPAKKSDRPEDKPLHYKVICISMYTNDLERLDGMVEALKKRGLTKANRSALIRAALEQIDLDKVPKGM